MSDILAPLVFDESGFQILFDVFLIVAEDEIAAVFFGGDGFFDPLAALFLIAVFFVAAEQSGTERRHGTGIAQARGLCVTGESRLHVLQFGEAELALIKACDEQHRRNITGVSRAVPPEDRLVRIGSRSEFAAQIGFAQNAPSHRRIVLGGGFERFARLVALLFFFGSKQDEGEPVNRVLVFSRGRLAVIFERLVPGCLRALAGFVGETEEIESVHVSLLGKGFGHLHGLGVAAGLEGFHGFFRRTLGGGKRRGTARGQRNSGLKGGSEN